MCLDEFAQTLILISAQTKLAHTYSHTHIHTLTHTQTHTRTHTHARAHTYTRTRAHLLTHAQTLTHTRICTHTHLHTHAFAHARAHTRKHTHSKQDRCLPSKFKKSTQGTIGDAADDWCNLTIQWPETLVCNLCFGFILVYAKHPGFCEDPVSKRDILNCSCNRCIYGEGLSVD